MNEELQSLASALEAADALLREGQRATAWTWPTGFDLLDTYLAGGLRAGELCLLGGPQGLGKTTFVLQVARNVVASGGACVVFSFEHDSTTLLERFIALEAGELYGLDGPPLRRVREVLEGGGPDQGGLQERFADTMGGEQAVSSLRGFGERMLLHRALGSSTDLAEIRRLTEDAMRLTERRPLVIVDYLQKVSVPGGAPEPERVTTIVEGLKDLALDLEVPVLSVVAADNEGITAGRRLRVNHLRGSSALAYEPDVILVFNDKYDVVARHHLTYATGGAERFHGYVVLSIEKNRSGLDHIDLQLRKRFDQSRFDIDLEPVGEQLVDERVLGD